MQYLEVCDRCGTITKIFPSALIELESFPLDVVIKLRSSDRLFHQRR
ncbi:hypothetical protein [Okeania sp. SIO1I7]|nr:hypothetical protein [Okeania sp. SIO1I7]NET25246.1 hypothetical protein [Okeania sp. SIO1I7]